MLEVMRLVLWTKILGCGHVTRPYPKGIHVAISTRSKKRFRDPFGKQVGKQCLISLISPNHGQESATILARATRRICFSQRKAQYVHRATSCNIVQQMILLNENLKFIEIPCKNLRHQVKHRINVSFLHLLETKHIEARLL